MERKQVALYTDGACSGNPGPGGYGVILCHGPHEKVLSAGFRRTTNNRMELLAVIVGLEQLNQPCQVTLVSDSRYVVDALAKGWLRRWQAAGYRKADGKPVLNPDLWRRLAPLLERHEVRPVWVRGHEDNPYNNRCDALAVAAAASPAGIDEVFEQGGAQD
ncbi:MAG: ribonuclease HI [Clostridiales bacterium]|nr:ribonuclease HI [Clostridiales bacterium]